MMMKVATLLLCCSALTMMFAARQTAAPPQDAREVTRLEREFARAAAAGDAAAMEKYLAENFLAVDAAGNELSKQDLVARMKLPGYEIASLEHADIRVRVFGDCAVVRARTLLKARYNGQDVSGEYPYTRTWVRARGRWLAAASFSLPVPPRKEDDTAERERVAQLEREVGEAITRRDRARLEQLIADDFVAVNPQGVAMTKAQALAQVTSPEYALESLVNDEIEVRLFGDVALARARGTARGRIRGAETSAQIRYLRVWVKRAGQWQAIAAQATPLETP
jgi:ketosteroid isomerase-like protein